MTDQLPTSITIRSELVDVATEFLKNPKIVTEKMERKREFLQKKGLTDTEINYAFQLMPQSETTEKIISTDRPSFLRRFLNDLAFAGLLVIALKLIKHLSNTQNQSNQTNELNETIKTLQKSVGDMQTTVVKLEQTVDQLNSSMQTASNNRSSIEEIKREIQVLKGLSLNRSQFPQVPSRQLITTKKTEASVSIDKQTTIDNDSKDDTDGIIVISEQDKKSDDENLSSNDN